MVDAKRITICRDIFAITRCVFLLVTTTKKKQRCDQVIYRVVILKMSEISQENIRVREGFYKKYVG